MLGINMNPVDIVKKIQKAFGVKDARINDNYKIEVIFYDERDIDEISDVKEFLQSVGYELDSQLSYKKLVFRSQ